MPRANVDGDLLRVYAHSGPEYDVYERLSETFGTFENDIYLLVRSPDLTDPDVLERVRELSFDLELSDYASGTMSPFSLRKPRQGGGSDPAVPEGMTDRRRRSRAALTDLQQNDPMMRNLIMGDLDGRRDDHVPQPGDDEGQGRHRGDDRGPQGARRRTRRRRHRGRC